MMLGKRFLARPERLELPTYWFEASRSIQLSYGRAPPTTLLYYRCGPQQAAKLERYFGSAGLAGAEEVDPFSLARDWFTRLVKSPASLCSNPL